MERTAQVGALAEQHVMQCVVRAGCNVALPVADIDGIDLYVCGPTPPQTAGASQGPPTEGCAYSSSMRSPGSTWRTCCFPSRDSSPTRSCI